MARYKTGLETRDRILGATEGLLAEEGPEKTTIQAICDRAEIRPGSFYNLFRSKDDAVFEVVLDAVRDAATRPVGSPSVDEFIDQFLGFVVANPNKAMIYLRLGVSGAVTHSDIIARIRHFHEKRVDYLAAALASANPQLKVSDATPRAELMLATLNGLTLRYLMNNDFDLTRHIEMVRGMAAPAVL